MNRYQKQVTYLSSFIVMLFGLYLEQAKAQVADQECISSPGIAAFDTILEKLQEDIVIVEQFLKEFEDSMEDISDEFSQLNETNCLVPICDPQAPHLIGMCDIGLPQWVYVALLTSPTVSMYVADNVYYAVLENQEKEYTFELTQGDHNLWYDEDLNLWGYNMYHHIFKITPDTTVILSLGMCCAAEQHCHLSAVS